MNPEKSSRFSLTVNNQQDDGFKLNWVANHEKALNIYNELTKKIIEKITKIEVKVTNDDRYE